MCRPQWMFSDFLLLFENFIIQKSFEQIYSLSFPFSISPTSHSASCFMCSTYKPTECCLHVQEQGLPTGGQAVCQWSHALRKLDCLPPVPTNCHTDHLGLWLDESLLHPCLILVLSCAGHVPGVIITVSNANGGPVIFCKCYSSAETDHLCLLKYFCSLFHDDALALEGEDVI